MRFDRLGRAHDEHGRYSAVLWRVHEPAGRLVVLTDAALRHARGEDEPTRELRTYLTAETIRIAVERGKRYADPNRGRERLVADEVGPSTHLVVIPETYASADTVVTAFAMRRVPPTWRSA